MHNRPTPGGDLKIVLWLAAVSSLLKVLHFFTISWAAALAPVWLYGFFMFIKFIFYAAYIIICQGGNFKNEMSIWFLMQRDCLSRAEAGTKFYHIKKKKQDARNATKKRLPSPL